MPPRSFSFENKASQKEKIGVTLRKERQKSGRKKRYSRNMRQSANDHGSYGNITLAVLGILYKMDNGYFFYILPFVMVGVETSLTTRPDSGAAAISVFAAFCMSSRVVPEFGAIVTVYSALTLPSNNRRISISDAPGRDPM